MMSWLWDSATCTSSQQAKYELAFEDPAYIRYLEGDLGMDVDSGEGAGQNRVWDEAICLARIVELEAQLHGEKLNSKKLGDDSLKLQFELAAQDQLTAEMEEKLEAEKKMNEELEEKLEAEKKMNEELEGKLALEKKMRDDVKCFAVASLSVCVTLCDIVSQTQTHCFLLPSAWQPLEQSK